VARYVEVNKDGPTLSALER